MLAIVPIGALAFPGSGISANLADKAKRLGIRVWKFGEDGARAPPRRTHADHLDRELGQPGSD